MLHLLELGVSLLEEGKPGCVVRFPRDDENNNGNKKKNASYVSCEVSSLFFFFSPEGVLAVREVGRTGGRSRHPAFSSPHASDGGGVQLLALALGHSTGTIKVFQSGGAQQYERGLLETSLSCSLVIS